jgi:CheY-like chemotaxis protein
MEALGQMASGIAHDFNNALSPILGFTELLLRDPQRMADAERLERYLGIIHTSSQDAANVVRRMLEFGRRRDADVPTAHLDLTALVQQTVELTRPRWKDQAQARGQTIHIETDLQPLPPLPGDESSLRELLTNLIFNAVDALPAGGTIRLQTSRLGELAMLRVSDTGTGMTETVRLHCMEPFYSTKGERGSGLGLAMVYGIVQRHGGTLEIISAPGRGTTFIICLPLPTNGQATGATAAPGAPQQALHLLLVDDEPMVREALGELLGADGHTISVAGDGEAGLASFRAGQFDVVITDQSMPKMNGAQLALAIRALAPAVPVIMLTGFGDLMIAAGERPPGVTAILSKPFTQAQLRTVLAQVLPAPPLAVVA